MELASGVSRVIGDNKLIVAASFVMQTGHVRIRLCKGAVQVRRARVAGALALTTANYRSLINPVN